MDHATAPIARTESSQALTGSEASHGLKRELGLRDLVPMQILLVVGITWAGIAARQGGTHVAFWVAAILFLFVPLAAVVGWCAKIWPYEGGVYQWTRHIFGPFAGFMSAWNFGLWALLTVSNIGIISATSLSYGLGPSAAWMGNSQALSISLSIGLFLLILVINLPGFGIGKWVSHFGTAVTVLVTVLLMVLLFFHPHASTAHPHHNPQPPFSLALPALTFFSINLFSKIAFNALSGLEQVAIFAGEIRNAGKTIMYSAWIAAPIVAVIYIFMTGAILAYIPAAQVDLTGPIPQILGTAFSTGRNTSGVDLGLLLGRATILILSIALVAQYAVIIAETSRLPMVAGWDGLIPAWFTSLHPRWKTPTRSIATCVLAALAMGVLASAGGAGAQEAFQLIVTSANILYGIYYVLLFLIPLAAGTRFGTAPGRWLKLAAASGLAMTLLATAFNFLPIVAVPSKLFFALKVAAASILLNLIGAAIYWRGTRQTNS